MGRGRRIRNDTPIERKSECFLPNPATAHQRPPSFDKGVESSINSAVHKFPRTGLITEAHPTSYRPWGGYTSILNGDRFQVKRLFVTPGKRLSLQKHHHRSEHWICVKGTAEVTIGDETRIVRENESVYIPQGKVHRLANPGKILLEIIEVQTGSYLGEGDIIRIVDEFGRS